LKNRNPKGNDYENSDETELTVGSRLRRPLQYMRTPLNSAVLPDENQRLLLVVSITPPEHSGFLNEDSPVPPPARFSL
jgi:hypothetical protein